MTAWTPDRKSSSGTAGWLALAAGGCALAAPTLGAVAQRSWATEQGEYGVLALAIGVYLLVRDLRGSADASAVAPSPRVLTLALGALATLLYLFARLSAEYLFEAYALWLAGVAALSAFVSLQRLRRLWFALAFLLLALPTPRALLLPLSTFLRRVIAQAAVGFLRAAHILVSRDGLSLFIDSHQIDVRQACSGLNSLVSISLIALAYVHLVRAPRPSYVAFLALPIFGAAVLANFVRVLVVVLMTHGFGESVGQGLLHEGAGLLSFAVALSLVIGLDALVGPMWGRSRHAAQR